MKVFLLVMALLFGGCSIATSQSNYFNSTIVSKNNNIDNTIIADDMFKFVSTYYAPNKTNLYISTNDFSKKFYNYLIQKFRDQGYAITSDNTLKNLTFLSYNIRVDNNTIFVNYNINESKISRMYIVDNDRIVRTGGLTRFNFTLEPLPFLNQAPFLAIVEDEKVQVANTFDEQNLKPIVSSALKTNIQEKKKVQDELIISSSITPKKEKSPTLVLKVQKPFKSIENNKRKTSQTPQKEPKIPLAIGEDGKPIKTSKMDVLKRNKHQEADLNISAIVKQLENNTTIAPQEPHKEEKKPIEEVITSFNQVGDSMMKQGVKEEVKPETSKIETPTVDKNTSEDQKILALVEQLKNNSIVIKTDTKPKVETVVINDRPFDADPTPNNIVAKELTLVEIIEEAVAVYPNFDEKKLREDLMRLVVKNPNIDVEAVRTMPLKKALLLELLKVAKEKK